MLIRSIALSTLSFVLSLGIASSVSADGLKPNMEKSKIEFVGHKADGKHAGGFKKFELEAKADFEDPAKSSLKIVIHADSLWSDADKLTEHLRNEDFFDVKQHPKITFESTKIEHSKDDGKAKIFGKLKMLGKTEEVEIPVDFELTEENVKVTAKFKLDRTKWGMDYGKGMINDDVDVVAVFVFGR
ncbi:MAG: YceI family protein [Pirellulaceae bacterium]